MCNICLSAGTNHLQSLQSDTCLSSWQSGNATTCNACIIMTLQFVWSAAPSACSCISIYSPAWLSAIEFSMTWMICWAVGLQLGSRFKQAKTMSLTACGHSWGTCRPNKRIRLNRKGHRLQAAKSEQGNPERLLWVADACWWESAMLRCCCLNGRSTSRWPDVCSQVIYTTGCAFCPLTRYNLQMA